MRKMMQKKDVICRLLKIDEFAKLGVQISLCS
jgi:hypothetical protein